MPGIDEQPIPYLAFITWHVMVGFLGVHAVNRWRYGRASNLVLGRATRGARRSHLLHRAVGVASLLWGASIVAFAGSPAFRELPFGRPLIDVSPAAGWAIAVLAHLGVLSGQLGMGPAFRIGQDPDDESTTLVEHGLHAHSRNPIYVFSLAFLVAEWTWTPSALTGAMVLAHAAGFHAIVLEEERVLEGRLGEPYRAYRRRVPRYLGRARRS